MIEVCMKCWDIPCSCGKGYLVEIDDNIFDDIIMLNKKGYKTIYCCEGHRENTLFDMYIMFGEDMSKYNIPLPLKLDRNKHIVRFKKWSDKATDLEIENARRTLKKWVTELPDKSM